MLRSSAWDSFHRKCAFITDEMTQGAFEEKLAQIGDQVLAKIRVKD